MRCVFYVCEDILCSSHFIFSFPLTPNCHAMALKKLSQFSTSFSTRIRTPIHPTPKLSPSLSLTSLEQSIAVLSERKCVKA